MDCYKKLCSAPPDEQKAGGFPKKTACKYRAFYVPLAALGFTRQLFANSRKVSDIVANNGVCKKLHKTNSHINTTSKQIYYTTRRFFDNINMLPHPIKISVAGSGTASYANP